MATKKTKKDRTFSKSFLLSLVVHLALIAFLAHQIAAGGKGSGDGDGGKEEKQGQKGGDPMDDFIAKEEEARRKKDEPVEVTLMTQDDLFKVLDQKKKEQEERDRKEKEECLDGQWYGGIGIESEWTGEVGKVAEGYAADKAGIRPGDTLVTNTGAIRGEPGTSVQVIWYSKGTNQRHDEMLVREKICYRPKPKKGSP